MSIEYQFQDRDNKVFCVPAGVYGLGLVKAEVGLSKAGNDQIKLTLKVLTTESGKEVVDGPTVFDYLSFDEKSSWKVDVFLKAIKRQPKKGEVLTFDTEYCEKVLQGTLTWANLTVDEYQGRKNNKIAQYICNRNVDLYKIYTPAAAAASDDNPI